MGLTGTFLFFILLSTWPTLLISFTSVSVKPMGPMSALFGAAGWVAGLERSRHVGLQSNTATTLLKSTLSVSEKEGDELVVAMP